MRSRWRASRWAWARDDTLGQMSGETVKFLLGEGDIPQQWINLLVDLLYGWIDPRTRREAGS